jgi:YHS domain-containing protein
MFSILFRILLLIFVLWQFIRLLAAFMGAPKKNRPMNDTTGAANYMVKDPICGMYMDSRLAVRLERRNEAFYFCSEECKKKYLNKSTGEGIGSAAAG